MKTLANAPARFQKSPIAECCHTVEIDHEDKTYSVTVDQDGTIGRVVIVEYFTIDGMRSRALNEGAKRRALIERATQVIDANIATIATKH